MSDDTREPAPDETAHLAADLTPDEARMASLLRDLVTLHGYLEERGRHTYELAQRFLENARRDSSSRAYDERQATMLEYQHYIWHEIAGRLSQLIQAYGDDAAGDDTMADSAATSDGSETTGEA